MTYLGTLARKLEIDPAVRLMLLSRLWQAVAGPVTLILIAVLVTPEIQGYYYTFASLIATQTFVELGLSIVILNVASHDSGRIAFGARGLITGDADAAARVNGLGQFVVKWYSLAALAFVVLTGILGFVLFSQAGDTYVNWAVPWIAIVVISGFQFFLAPFTSLLEGCGRVVEISRLRLWQGIASSTVLCLSIALWADLWAPVASSFAALVVVATFFGVRYPRLFESFFAKQQESRFDWRRDVWPIQWRFALMGMVNYFIYSLFTPVIFHYHGAVEAGRVGMTVQVLYLLQAAALTWVQSKVSLFGTLIAGRAFNDLDRIWFRMSGISMGAMVLGGAVLELLLVGLPHFDPSLANRLLSPLPTLIFLVGVCSMHAIACMAIYLRAHKREPLTWIGVVGGLCCGALVWQLGKTHGVVGAAIAYSFVLTFLNLPAVSYVWFKSRRSWH